MLLPMIVLAVAGVGLLLAAPVIAQLIVGRDRDSLGARRILQIIAGVLLIGALFARPYNPDTSAVPPSPNTGGTEDVGP
jgi:hypothetical protein